MALDPLSVNSKIVVYNSDVSLTDKTPAPKTQGATIAEVLALAGGGGVDGSNSVYVTQQGTAAESGVLLLQAYQDAIAKIGAGSEPSTLIIGPGDYSIPTDWQLNQLVNVTSLTGQPDVNITNGNIAVGSGANDAAHPITITGLNLQTTTLTVGSNLSSITFKNCIALGEGSFSGGSSISSRFEDCIGGYNSFGSGGNSTASGIFIRCKAGADPESLMEGAFGAIGNTSGYFEDCGGVETAGGSTDIEKLFGEGGVCNGVFYNCKAGNFSFGYQCFVVGADFYNCVGKLGCFGYQNYFDFTTGNFYNCKAEGASFGSSMGNSGLLSNCISGSFGEIVDGGMAFSCYSSSGGFVVAGTGKTRLCVDNAGNIVNIG